MKFIILEIELIEEIVMTFLPSKMSNGSVPRHLFGGFNATAHCCGFNVVACPQMAQSTQWSWAQ